MEQAAYIFIFPGRLTHISVEYAPEEMKMINYFSVIAAMIITTSSA